MTTKQDQEVKAKQFWRRKSTGQQVRVLGVVEGYVVARVKGCGPFLYGRKDFEKDFDLLYIASAERPNAEMRGASRLHGEASLSMDRFGVLQAPTFERRLNCLLLHLTKTVTGGVYSVLITI